MTGRKLLFLGILALVACLLTFRTVFAQDDAAPPAPGEREAADDDFGPPALPPPRGDREQRGPRDFGPRKPALGERPGGPRGERPGPPGERVGGPPAVDRPGPPVGPGPGDGRGAPVGPPGPGRPPGPPDQPGRYPSGPPRWPHEGWQELQKNDPELWKLLRADLDLEERTRQLALQYRQAPEGQREAIRKDMEKLVGEHFDVRQQRRVLELNRLHEELKRLQQSIDDRNKAREQIVNKRVQELLGTDEGLRF